MKKITYYDLLTMIKEGTQPETIKYAGIWFDFSQIGKSYIARVVFKVEKADFLSYILGLSYGENGFLTEKVIEIIEEDKPIEKINSLNHSLTERLSLIREDIGLAFETIDLLIDKVNELEREMKK